MLLNARWPAFALLVHLVLLPPPLQHATAPSQAGGFSSLGRNEVERRYLTILDRYASGDCARAVLDLFDWSSEQLEQALRFTAGPAWALLPPPERMRVSATIVMLHTETGFSAIIRQFESIGFLTARSEVERMTASATAGIQPLIHERDWYLAVVQGLAGSGAYEDAAALIKAPLVVRRAGPKTVEDLLSDRAEGVLAIGSVEEAIAIDLLHMHETVGPSVIRNERLILARTWDRAEKWFRRGLELDPTNSETRLRRGHVLFRRDRLDEAARELQAVGEEAADPGLRHLAWLFLGRVRERQQRLVEAAALYENAVELVPHAQGARIAWSKLLERLGRALESRAAILPFIARPSAAALATDPWLRYQRGQGDLGQARLDEMKALVVRR